jgi:endonuclease-3
VSDVKDDFVEDAVRRLVEHHQVVLPGSQPAYETLVRTLMSQHTTEAVSVPLSRAVLRRFPGPAELSSAPAGELEAMLEPMGLHRQKAAHLRELGRVLCERYGGDAEQLLELPQDKMRRELMSLKGVGEKTADCFMLFSAGLDVLPVDTHVARIARLWELVADDADYGDVRSALEGALPRGLYGKAHIALILHGRATCRARKPLCWECTVSKLCPLFARRTHT